MFNHSAVFQTYKKKKNNARIVPIKNINSMKILKIQITLMNHLPKTTRMTSMILMPKMILTDLSKIQEISVVLTTNHQKFTSQNTTGCLKNPKILSPSLKNLNIKNFHHAAPAPRVLKVSSRKRLINQIRPRLKFCHVRIRN